MATDIGWVLKHNPKYKDCAWFITGDQSLKNLNWGSGVGIEDNDIAKPTQKELDDYFNANKTAYDSAVSVGKREYPLIGDQLDLLYHDITAGKLDATGEWYKAIKAIKDANPKE
jgi:hypothetical protein